MTASLLPILKALQKDLINTSVLTFIQISAKVVSISVTKINRTYMNERIIPPTREELEADNSDDAKKRQTFERGSDGRLPKITANEISEIEKMIYAYLDNGAKFEDIQPIVNDKLKELGVDLDLVKDGGVAIVFVDIDGREVERVIVVDSRDFGTTILNSEIAEIPKLAELSEQSLLPDLSDKSFTPNVTDSTETPLPSLSPDWPTAE